MIGGNKNAESEILRPYSTLGTRSYLGTHLLLCLPIVQKRAQKSLDPAVEFVLC